MKIMNRAKVFIALLLMVCMTAHLSAQAGRASTIQAQKTLAVDAAGDCGFMVCSGCECKLDFCPCATNLETTEMQRKNITRYESLLRSYDSNVTTKAANDVAIIRIAIQNNDLALFKSAFESYTTNVAQLSVDEKVSIQSWGAATRIAVSVEVRE